MRSTRSAVAVCILLFAVPSWGKQPPQNAATPQPASDPQAVSVVQAAITALGGATAIEQPQSWTFQANLEGPIANGAVTYSVGRDDRPLQTPITLPNGKIGRARPVRSLFVPILVGAILVNQSNDPQFVMAYGGLATIGSESVAIVTFSAKSMPTVISQVWWFDATTSLPRRAAFTMPAELGTRISFPGLMDFSDYRPISGVLHPFRVVTQLAGRSPQVIAVQSALSTSGAPASDFDPNSGDLL